MTEPVGRSARWGTIVVVAPLAAAALAVATSWGVTHPPVASGQSSSTGQASAPAVPAGHEDSAGQDTAYLDKSVLALQQQALTERGRVIRLQRILDRVNARTRAVARAPLTGVGDSSSTGRSASAGSGGGGSVAAPPRVAAAPARAAAPATHTSTGAS